MSFNKWLLPLFCSCSIGLANAELVIFSVNGNGEEPTQQQTNFQPQVISEDNIVASQSPQQYIVRKIRVRKPVIPEHDNYQMSETQQRQLNTMVETHVLDTQPRDSKTGYIRPVNYAINSGYGMRIHPIHRVAKMHTGVDFAAPYGTPIKAVASGIVQFADWHGGYGKMVLLAHDSHDGNMWNSLYGHASQLNVKAGQRVKQGDILAFVGSTGQSTGNHLHFEIFKNNQRINPASVLPKQTPLVY